MISHSSRLVPYPWKTPRFTQAWPTFPDVFAISRTPGFYLSTVTFQDHRPVYRVFRCDSATQLRLCTRNWKPERLVYIGYLKGNMSPLAANAPGNVSIKSEPSYRSPPLSLSDASQNDAEDHRGRKQDRDRSSTAKGEDDSGDDRQDGGDNLDGKPRKRKRSRKGSEKNFACPYPGCGKSYSRAEHLYRHQLNREPLHSHLRVSCLYCTRSTQKNIRLRASWMRAPICTPGFVH